MNSSAMGLLGTVRMPSATNRQVAAGAIAQNAQAAATGSDATPFLDTLRRELAEPAVADTPSAPVIDDLPAAQRAQTVAGELVAKMVAPRPDKDAAEPDKTAAEPDKNATLAAADAAALTPLLQSLLAPALHAAVAPEPATGDTTPEPVGSEAHVVDKPVVAELQSERMRFTAPADAGETGAGSQSGDDRRAAAIAATEGALASLTGAAIGEPQPAHVQEAVVKLPAESTQWRQPLTQALGDRLELMRSRNSDTAVIRLDPPMMGRIEISIRQEAGALKVSLTATHNEVLRQLQGIGDSLRADLSQRQFGEVSVQVSDAGASRFAQGDADGRQRQRQSEPQEPGRALAEAELDHEAGAFRLARDQE